MKQKAEQITSQLKSLIEKLTVSRQGPEIEEKRKQLTAIEKSVKQMQRSGVAIPSEIRDLKSKLINELSQADQSEYTLDFLKNELIAVLKDLGVSATKNNTSGTTKRAKGPKTDRTVLRQYIIEALRSYGGKANIKTCLDWMEKELAGKLTPRDLSCRKSGEIVWRNNAQWERYKMKEDGILKSDSANGIWELNEEYL